MIDPWQEECRELILANLSQKIFQCIRILEKMRKTTTRVLQVVFNQKLWFLLNHFLTLRTHYLTQRKVSKNFDAMAI